MLFTFGFCGIDQFLDLFLHEEEVNEVNRRLVTSTSVANESVTRSPPTSPEPQSLFAFTASASIDELDQLLK